MRYLRMLVLCGGTIMWVWISLTFEPFKTHLWLALLGAGITSAALLFILALIVRVRKTQ